MPILHTPYKALVYGQEGVGKSTDAAKWPNPHFIDCEGSTERMDVNRLPNRTPYMPPQSWSEVFAIINTLMGQPSAEMQKTLVIDTIDSLTPMVVQHVIATNPKKDGGTYTSLTGFGWDSGYALVSDEFSRLFQALDELRLKKQWHIVLVCHGTVRRLDLPEEDLSYERWEPDMFRRPKNTPSPYDLVKSWAEMILFYSFKTIIVETENKKAKAAGEQRVIRTTHSATWDAKNRNGLPDEIPLEKEKFALACLFHHKTTPPPPATANAIAPPPPSTPPTTPTVDATPAHSNGNVSTGTMLKLESLMLGTWPEVTQTELMAAVHAAGHFPADMPLYDLPEDYVAGRLVGNWDKVLKVVERIRSQKAKQEGEAAA